MLWLSAVLLLVGCSQHFASENLQVFGPVNDSPTDFQVLGAFPTRLGAWASVCLQGQGEHHRCGPQRCLNAVATSLFRSSYDIIVERDLIPVLFRTTK